MTTVFLVCIIIQLVFVITMLAAIASFKQSKAQEQRDDESPISVVIAARNEAENLSKNLPAVLQQVYSTFEVVVVLDRCTDNSKQCVEDLMQQHINLRFIEIEGDNPVPNKKGAIAAGIAQATHEHLVFTDADCVPADDQWLQKFAYEFLKGKNLVIGSGMFHQTNSIVNQLGCLDALIIALKYFTAARLGFAYMAVGRSMGYTKSLFQAVNGFSSHQHIASGDDDLFVQSAMHHAKIGIVPEALTISQTPQSWKEWKRQKARHMTTGRRYSISRIILLAVYEITDLISVLGLFIYFYQEFETVLSVFFILFVLKTVLLGYTIDLLGSKMKYDSRAFSLIFYQPLLTLVYPLFSIFSLMHNPTAWNHSK